MVTRAGRLYVVRHAEPAVRGVLLGRSDPPLSERGRREAKDRLGGLDVAVVYSSPLRRCSETATAMKAPVHILEDLAEISMGEWDGLKWADIEQHYPAVAGRKSRDWFGVTPPGGEPWYEFAARVERALNQVRQGPSPAAVVTHIAVSSVIEQILAGNDPATFQQEYCEIREYEFEFGSDVGPEN